MTNRFMVSVAALALIAGTGLANAQQGTKGGEAGGNATQHSAPADTSAAPSRSDSSGAAKSESSEKGGMKSTQSEHEKGGMKSTQSEQKSPSAMKKESAQGTKEKSGAATNQRAEEKSGNMKSEGRERDNNMKAEGRDRDRDNMKAEGRDSKSGTNAAETKSTTERSQTTGQAGAGAKLTTEQRTKITTVIHNERVAPVTNVNFSVSVGTRVPHEGITLHRLPSEVVTIYPEWRSYEYIVVRSQIIVIDPGTYEIVAILDA